jgi:hypothetical protein
LNGLFHGNPFTSADLIQDFQGTPEIHMAARARMGCFARLAHYKEKAGSESRKKREKIMAARI